MGLVSFAMLVAAARSGKLVSFPTDTVPAMAIKPDRRDDIFQLKQRSPDKPLILMASCWDELLPFIDTNNPAIATWQDVAHQYFPGAVTLVLPASDRGQLLNQGFSSLGVRIPDCREAIAVLQQTGALLTTSANKSNDPPLRSMAAISEAFPSIMTLGDGVPIAEDLGSGLPSTVVEWTADGWIVRRQGAVKI